MIFQSLVSLYDRLYEKNLVPPFGFSLQAIGFVINIDNDGNMIGPPEDMRETITEEKKIGNKTKTTTKIKHYLSIAPHTNKIDVRSSGLTPNFMTDKPDYTLGMNKTVDKKEHFESFVKLIEEVTGNSDDDGVIAIKNFLRKWNPVNANKLEAWDEMCGINGRWMAFRLVGDVGFIHDRPAVKKLWVEHVSKEQHPEGYSFVDGQTHKIQEQYTKFKIGKERLSLVSFNSSAYESYGKEKGENAPIGIEEEFKSASALKYLISNKFFRTHIGDTTAVFWAERASAAEIYMGEILNPSYNAGDSAPVQKFLESVSNGKLPVEIEKDKDVKFYILGLVPNRARLSVRFWYVCSVSELMNRICDHFNNLKMKRSADWDIEFPGVWHLLKETARENKGISPLLGGQLMRSILTGSRYPQNLYQGVLNRIRADQDVNYLRASILKAVLQRNYKWEVPVALDINKKEPAYLLGRLFAVLEQAQKDALGKKINTTIKDKFFCAAAATPSSVFPRLLQLAQHHMAKSDYGYISDIRISEITEHLDNFPTHLSLNEQGLFVIAYYQQKNALYKKEIN